MMQTIKAIVRRPEETVGQMVDIPNNLKALQQIVDGYIETLTLDNGLVLIFNEEGLIRGLPENLRIGRGHIRGTVIVVGKKGDEFADVPLEIPTWKTLLRLWGNPL